MSGTAGAVGNFGAKTTAVSVTTDMAMIKRVNAGAISVENKLIACGTLFAVLPAMNY